jgi:DNA repair exonuclease SbcCD ATPase subunit
MVRPLSTPDLHRGGANGHLNGGRAEVVGRGDHTALLHGRHAAATLAEDPAELEQFRAENGQLRALCLELEQALHESTQHRGGAEGAEDRLKEYESLLDAKSDTISQLAQQAQDLQTCVADLEQQLAQAEARRPSGPTPREDELLALSEDLERERKQLQEDEQSLMQQMRDMEVGMARERAEMARQRNDLQRLQGEIRHELERLERNGALQSKINDLKSKLSDATTRRGSAPSSPSAAPPMAVPVQTYSPPPTKKDSLMGRLFGGGR